MYYTLLSSTAGTGAQLDDKDYEGSRSRAHHSQSNTHCIVWLGDHVDAHMWCIGTVRCVGGGGVGVCVGGRCLCVVCMCVGVYVWVGAI